MAGNGGISLFTLGLGFGISLAVAGAMIEVLLMRRNLAAGRPRQLPGCMLYVAGILGLAGIVAVLGSFLLSGTIGPALLMGAGILSGFYGAFAVLFLAYLFYERFWPGR